MQLAITTTDGSTLRISDFPPAGVMDILDAWEEHPVLTLALDDGMAYIPKANIVRIDTHNAD